MKVRDEHRMTLRAYEILYENSVIFGEKKHLESSTMLNKLEEKI